MPDRVAEIRARVGATIPGPWGWYGNVATDQVYLATRDRGRLILLSPEVRASEYVFDHDVMETYSLDSARERVIDWCGVHGEGSDPDRREVECQCDALREFLTGELGLTEGRRDYMRPTGYVWLTRHLEHRPDLMFAAKEPVERFAEFPSGRKTFVRNEHGGERLVSYRDIARFEVLGGKTREESPEGNLYREDIVGLDNPEAELIAHARDDLEYLLDRVAELERQVRDAQRGAPAHHRLDGRRGAARRADRRADN